MTLADYSLVLLNGWGWTNERFGDEMMKTRKLKKDDYEFYAKCDICKRREAFGHITIEFWYGSKFDTLGQKTTYHICDGCYEKKKGTVFIPDIGSVQMLRSFGVCGNKGKK